MESSLGVGPGLAPVPSMPSPGPCLCQRGPPRVRTPCGCGSEALAVREPPRWDRDAALWGSHGSHWASSLSSSHCRHREAPQGQGHPIPAGPLVSSTGPYLSQQVQVEGHGG